MLNLAFERAKAWFAPGVNRKEEHCALVMESSALTKSDDGTNPVKGYILCRTRDDRRAVFLIKEGLYERLPSTLRLGIANSTLGREPVWATIRMRSQALRVRGTNVHWEVVMFDKLFSELEEIA